MFIYICLSSCINIYIYVCVCMYTATQRERMESMLCQCFVACVIVFTHWLSAAMRWSELDQTNRRTLRSALSRSSVVCRHVCRVFTRWTGEKSTGNCLKHATSKKHAVNNLIRLGVSLIVFTGSYHSFNKILLSRLTWGFMSDVGFRVYDEGFAWV